MKKLVIEALEVRQLSHIFSEKKFNSYYKKVNKSARGNNAILKAYSILDLFIVNASVTA